MLTRPLHFLQCWRSRISLRLLEVLQHRSDNYDYAWEASSETATEIQALMVRFDAKVSALNTVILTLAVGTLRNAVHARAGLLDRKTARGPVALLFRQRNVAETDAQTTAAINAPKASL